MSYQQIFSQIIAIKNKGMDPTILFQHGIKESDSDEVRDGKRKKANSVRRKYESIPGVRNVLLALKWLKINDESVESYCEMIKHANFISQNVVTLVRGFLKNNPDVRDFLAVHGDNDINSIFVPGVMKDLESKIVKIKKSETMVWKAVNMFAGRPVKYDYYPDISVMFDGGRFIIRDEGFLKPKSNEWRDAPILVLEPQSFGNNYTVPF